MPLLESNKVRKHPSPHGEWLHSNPFSYIFPSWGILGIHAQVLDQNSNCTDMWSLAALIIKPPLA